MGDLTHSFISLSNGRHFHLDTHNMQFEVDIKLSPKVIAHSLAYQCRYGGHCSRFYSVAEHTLILTEWAAKQSHFTPQDILTILHHDDSEAVLGDMVGPLKRLVPKFKEYENALDRAISKSFDTIWPHPEWLKELDTNILVDEFAAIMRGVEPPLEGPPLGVKFKPIIGRRPRWMAKQWLAAHDYWTTECYREKLKLLKE